MSLVPQESSFPTKLLGPDHLTPPARKAQGTRGGNTQKLPHCSHSYSNTVVVLPYPYSGGGFMVEVMRGLILTILAALGGWLIAFLLLSKLPLPFSLLLRRLAPIVGVGLAILVGYEMIPRPEPLSPPPPAFPTLPPETNTEKFAVVMDGGEYLVLPSGERVPAGRIAISLSRFPRPRNYRCVHWITSPVTPEEKAKKLVKELKEMKISMAVVPVGLDDYNIHAHDQLIRELSQAGIIPVARPMVKVGPVGPSFAQAVQGAISSGAKYIQVFNEPNLAEEWGEGKTGSPQLLAEHWAAAAQQVVALGGYPGLPPMAPQPTGDDERWLADFLLALVKAKRYDLLNLSWVGVHAYYSAYNPRDDRGFGLYRRYSAILQEVIGSPLPIIVTEGGLSPEAQIDPHTWGRWVVESYAYLAQERNPWLLGWCYWVLESEEPKWKPSAWFEGGNPKPVVQMMKEEP